MTDSTPPAIGWRARLVAGWGALLDSPGGPDRVARGAAAGAFAAMVPAFGAHLILAVLAAFVVRGTRAAAIAACLLIGNPLTHAGIVPVAYAVGRALLPDPPVPQATRLPHLIADLLPLAEDALAGGVVLGLVVAPVVFLLVRAAIRRRRP